MDRGKVFPVVLIALLIFLSVTLGVAIISQKDSEASEWSLNTTYTRTDAVYVGTNDTFITIDGKELYALGSDGTLKWRLHIPEADGVLANYSGMTIHSATTSGDIMYFLIKPTDDVLWQGEGEIMAVSSDGRLLWNTPRYILWNPELLAANETLYFYNVNGITAYGRDGASLWNITNVYTSPTVDEFGDVYAIQYQYPDGGWILKAYDPAGDFTWGRNLSDAGLGGVASCSVRDMTYHKGMLYVFIHNGLAAFDRSGDLQWIKDYGSPVWPMGFDSADRLYVGQYCPAVSPDGINLTVITPRGEEVAARANLTRGFNDLLYDGILYNLKLVYPPENSTIDQPVRLEISAYDVVSGKDLWSYDLKPAGGKTITLDESSLKTIFPWYAYSQIVPGNQTAEYIDMGRIIEEPYPAFTNQSYLRVISGNQLLYVSYWTFNYEYPIIINKSRCTCAGGIYAFDKDGRLAWQKQTDSYVTKMEEKNGTVYYETSDGRFSAATVDVAAGLIAAATYLFLRLLAAGTVTRARSRLDKNSNRNAVLDLIRECPGLTHHELARQLGLNLGTVRYHLVVLTLNHKVTAYTDDTKFIRYFKNSHSYSEDEKLVIALIRREPIRRLLALIVKGQWSSNIEVARALDMPESAVSKYLRELVGCGVIVKNLSKSEGPVYTISERYCADLKMYLTAPEMATDHYTASTGIV